MNVESADRQLLANHPTTNNQFSSINLSRYWVVSQNGEGYYDAMTESGA
jgi:hypothetical protein